MTEGLSPADSWVQFHHCRVLEGTGIKNWSVVPDHTFDPCVACPSLICTCDDHRSNRLSCLESLDFVRMTTVSVCHTVSMKCCELSMSLPPSFHCSDTAKQGWHLLCDLEALQDTSHLSRLHTHACLHLALFTTSQVPVHLLVMVCMVTGRASRGHGLAGHARVTLARWGLRLSSCLDM